MLYLKMPELHTGVSVLEHGHCFPAMTLGPTDLYNLYDLSLPDYRSQDILSKL